MILERGDDEFTEEQKQIMSVISFNRANVPKRYIPKEWGR